MPKAPAKPRRMWKPGGVGAIRQMSLDESLIVDLFAGGGGASTGIAWATGREPDIAVNHDPDAIAMHEVNHPHTRHYCESVWDVNPVDVTQGRPVGLIWGSPDCTHFSIAKGGQPVSKKIRGLAWVLVKWAALVRPQTLMMENVPEFQTWGPLIAKRDDNTGRLLKKVFSKDDDGDERCEIVVADPDEEVPDELQVMYPDPERKGETFRAFVSCLTTGLAPDHPAWDEIREVLGPDFPFERLEEGLGYNVEFKVLQACDFGAPTIRRRLFGVANSDGSPVVWPEPTHGDPKSHAVQAGKLKPWRTAADIIDWSIPCPSIFERKRPLKENTLRRIAKGIMKFVVNNATPFIIPVTHHGADRVVSIDAPLPTVTAAQRGEFALISAHLDRQFTRSIGHCADAPLGTVTAGGSGKTNLVAAFLAQYHGETGNQEARGQTLDRPIMTIDTSPRYAIATSHLVKLYGTSVEGQPVTEPMPTVTAGGMHVGEVRAFLVKYFSTAVGQEVTEPLHTVTAKARFGLVTIAGEDYQIVDIGMRMLEPRELFRAQGFLDDYIIDRDAQGNRCSKSMQIGRCGNSVPPVFSEALVRANNPQMCVDPYARPVAVAR